MCEGDNLCPYVHLMIRPVRLSPIIGLPLVVPFLVRLCPCMCVPCRLIIDTCLRITQVSLSYPETRLWPSDHMSVTGSSLLPRQGNLYVAPGPPIMKRLAREIALHLNMDCHFSWFFSSSLALLTIRNAGNFNHFLILDKVQFMRVKIYM